jgi:hypothetical protein
MCVMEIHAGQRLSTMAQACAHNTNTIIGDLDLLEAVLNGRHDHDALAALEQARQRLGEAYAGFLGLFQVEVGRTVQDDHGHVHDHDHPVGNERTLVDQAHHDATLARRYETR